MSSDGFAVDLEALSAVRDRVGRLAGELAGPPREVPGADVFGHGRLAEAVDRFAAEEKLGLGRLTAEAEAIRDRLADTVRAYQQGDESGADRFKGIGP
ncbi:hypothetical protein JOF56_010813 [Kibdelosporangium banguiense]|uniref:ESX-1 secretion-associated protein n=1 Tax=Kibdelosporangium banguiense TaxID=1365924 RepID=A0ABS4U2I8_9PSEU|nr:hypothetical protein [Kibdelosporangium banguiense]MBP2330428.1 hypothetical protein [Kibdelosporangium banguiense]